MRYLFPFYPLILLFLAIGTEALGEEFHLEPNVDPFAVTQRSRSVDLGDRIQIRPRRSRSIDYGDSIRVDGQGRARAIDNGSSIHVGGRNGRPTDCGDVIHVYRNNCAPSRWR